MSLKGIDVSDHQGDVDWDKVRNGAYRFAFAKATEGEDFRSRTFTAARITAMRRAGVVIGCYHYLRPKQGRHGRAEADHFVRVATAAGWDVKRDLPLAMDVEETDLGPTDTLEYASDFAKRVRSLTGRGVVTYSNPSFIEEHLGGAAPVDGEVLWIAAWDAPKGTPPIPPGFECEYTLFHQISDRGHVPGVSVPVNLDLFLGDTGHLERLIAGSGYLRDCGNDDNHDVLSTREVQEHLRAIGWPIAVDGVFGPRTEEAVRDFQRGFAEHRLDVDGDVGPLTSRALQWSNANDGRTSDHFKFREFRSKPESCNGNRWIKLDRALVKGLERYRHTVRGPVRVVSGYRDPAKNACEGGAPQSQHLYGNACDLDPKLPVSEVRSLRAFSGIGYQRSTGLVRHVDVRHRGPNTTGGTVDHPTVFAYD